MGMEKKRQPDVLLVEDSVDDSELTEFSMMQANDLLRLTHLKDGGDALNFIFSEKGFASNGVQSNLKLVVLDLSLPTVNGLEVLKRIRGNEATKMLPVVILTSSKDERDMAVAYELGANSYVIKPNRFDGFVKKVGSLAFYWSLVNVRPS